MKNRQPKILTYFIFFFTCLFSTTSFCKEKPRTFHHPEALMKQLHTKKKNLGKEIYDHYCRVCHAKKPDIAIGAPKLGVKNDWDWRQKQGLKKMLEKSKTGFNNMPPRGVCFECSYKYMKAAN
jgi:cytochrome c5